MGWAPVERSMMESRRWPRKNRSSRQKAPSSGPRWARWLIRRGNTPSGSTGPLHEKRPRRRRPLLRAPLLPHPVDAAVALRVVNAHQDLRENPREDDLDGGEQQHDRHQEPAEVQPYRRNVEDIGVSQQEGQDARPEDPRDQAQGPEGPHGP